MFSMQFPRKNGRFAQSFVCRLFLAPVITFVILTFALSVCAAQDQSSAGSGSQKQEAPPEAGGPQSDTGPYAIPKKKEEPPPTPPPAERPKKIEGMPNYSISVEVPLVNVPVSVITKDGQFVPGLKQDNFKVMEDGVPQKITSFNQSEAPITAVLLVEFNAGDYYFVYDLLSAAYSFAYGLKKDDWVAVISYDIKPHILTDFTQDKRAVQGALGELRVPGFSEANLFDALYDTLDRLDQIQGRKYVILVTTGIDTFSKLNLDQITKKIKTTKDVTIFPVSVGWQVRNYCETHPCGYSHGIGIPINNMDYLQADNEMNTFAKLTGGRAYFPRFQGEYPEIFQAINSDIRNQYMLAYHPTNAKSDGSYRKLKVEVVGPDGSALKVRDQKGKDVKYQIVAREGYTAKHTVD